VHPHAFASNTLSRRTEVEVSLVMPISAPSSCSNGFFEKSSTLRTRLMVEMQKSPSGM